MHEYNALEANMEMLGWITWSAIMLFFGAWCQRKGEEKQAEDDYMLGNLDPDIRRAVENRDNP